MYSHYYALWTLLDITLLLLVVNGLQNISKLQGPKNVGMPLLPYKEMYYSNVWMDGWKLFI